jgi:hypothetical protein
MKKVILALTFVFSTSLLLGFNQINASNSLRSEIQKHRSPSKPKGYKPPTPHKPKHLPKPHRGVK